MGLQETRDSSKLLEDLESEKIINATLKLQNRILYKTNTNQADKLT